MPTLRTDDGVSLSYQVFGEGPRNLLFMHGWAGSGAYFNQTIQHLNLSGLRVITFDFRGHGASDKVEEGYTLDRFARDTFQVADQAGADKFVVVGFSMSGKFAQFLPLVGKNRVIGQILIGGLPAIQIPFPDEVRQDWVSRAGNSNRLIELLTATFISQPVDPKVLARFGEEGAKAIPSALDQTLLMATQTSFAEELKTHSLPTLVVGGITDPFATPEMLRQTMIEPFPGARLVLVDCNHEIPIEKPLELAGLIEAFLAGLR